MPNILMIHHCRDFSSNDIYLENDYQLANSKLYGAQEMDCWAGFRILSKAFYTYRLQISVNLSSCQLISPKGDILGIWEIAFPVNIRDRISADYLNSFFKYWDTSIAQFSSSVLRSTILEIIEKNRIDLLWVETQFYDAALPKKFPSIVRSVNFEPKHVLREDYSVSRYLRFIGKIWSESKIARRREMFSISPSDSRGYKFLSGKEVPCLPLRQLSFLLEYGIQNYPEGMRLNPKDKYFYFAGSTYDVKHNLDNLITIIDKISPEMERELPEVHIRVFGNRFPQGLKLPKNVVPMSFHEDYFKIVRGSLGAIVPSKGGAGMQSKVFEAICLGIPLIANEKALSGYPFNPIEHYWRGSNPHEAFSAMRQVSRRRDDAIEKAVAARSLARSLFNSSILNDLVHQRVGNQIND